MTAGTFFFPFYEDDGTHRKRFEHPIQCFCTMQDFRHKLMARRKQSRDMLRDWSSKPLEELMVPLAALCFTRLLLTFNDTSATALSYQERLQNRTVGSALNSLQNNQDPTTLSDEPAPEGESDDEETQQTFYGEYARQRALNRKAVVGASALGRIRKAVSAFLERCAETGA